MATSFCALNHWLPLSLTSRPRFEGLRWLDQVNPGHPIWCQLIWDLNYLCKNPSIAASRWLFDWITWRRCVCTSNQESWGHTSRDNQMPAPLTRIHQDLLGSNNSSEPRVFLLILHWLDLLLPLNQVDMKNQALHSFSSFPFRVLVCSSCPNKTL